MSQHAPPAPPFTTPPFSTPPDAEAIAELAERAIAAMPGRLRRHVANLGITVEDLAEDDILDEMGIESAWELTGLYQGTPIGDRSSSDVARLPDRIVLYRQAILFEWIELGEDLARLVQNVVVHEIAHHFGFSDAEIEALEREMR
jgi:acetylglutamate kinase